MKKILIYIITVISIFFLTSCFGNKEKNIDIKSNNLTNIIEKNNNIDVKKISSGGNVKNDKNVGGNQIIYSENTLGENIEVAKIGKNKTKSEKQTLDF